MIDFRIVEVIISHLIKSFYQVSLLFGDCTVWLGFNKIANMVCI